MSEPPIWDNISQCYRSNGKVVTLDDGARIKFTMVTGGTYEGRIEHDVRYVRVRRMKRERINYNVRFNSEFAVGCVMPFGEVDTWEVV